MGMVNRYDSDMPTERDSRKPDPAEPWRYVCPNCEGQVQGKQHTTGEWDCSSCGRTIVDFGELWDKKYDEPVKERFYNS